MNTPQIFSNEKFGRVRIIMADNKPMFLANDVAKALGYVKPANAISSHCKGVTILVTPTEGGAQPVKYIPESDVYRLVMRSKLPQAEQFQDWVCDEVLPTIRKTGGYVAAHDNDTPEMIMARAVLVANETIAKQKQQLKQAHKQVAVLAPKAELMDKVLDTDQNKQFRDHFIELPVDLSECLFIATANTAETIPAPLLDRMEVIELTSYTDEEKLQIAKRHLLLQSQRAETRVY